MKVMQVVLLAALAAPAFASASPADDTREIERVERELCDAIRTGDAAAIKIIKTQL